MLLKRMNRFLFLWTIFLGSCNALSAGATTTSSVVTGASGYLGREIVHQLLDTEQDEIICLVRPARVQEEEKFWKNKKIKIMPYDMLDLGETLTSALNVACKKDESNCCVYHVASVFGPTEDHVQTALDNVAGCETVVKTIAKHNKNCKLVLTSSMAAVRGSGQEPSNGIAYTHEDWNTLSKLGDNWGSSYQWSKAESERRSWELANELGVQMTSLCPSFVFGPSSSSSSSFSIELVRQWVLGESPVQSRLCVDVRDVAAAHVAAGTLPNAMQQRYIVSSERRVPSQKMAAALKQVAPNPDKVTFDAKFQGGAIKIGDQEVVATQRLKDELGIELRPVKNTLQDMGRALLEISDEQI